ncbi:MAG TPA: cyclic nucleotide-binding domain-containing protein [Rhodocyclaceae bacterium]|jgi:CRP-like cAMP-binding protein|nr:cyclic nucleotide-binding domain-containing protein [Rhodocyclaceae bacterium]
MDLSHFLKSLPAFERFSERHLSIFADSLVVEDIGEGQYIHEIGKPGRAAYIIIEGATTVSKINSKDGLVEVVGEAREGEMVCMLGLVDDLPATRTYVAHARLKVAVLTRERYYALFLLAPPIAHQIQYMLATKLASALQERNDALRISLGQQRRPSLLERLLG